MYRTPLRLRLFPAVFALSSGILAASAPDPVPPTGGADAAGQQAAAPSAPIRERLQADYGKLPYTFEANGGQADTAVKFLARGPGYSLFLTPGEAVLALQTSQPNPAPQPRPGARPEPLSGPPPAAVPEPSAAATAPAVLRLSLVGANPEPVIRGEAPLPGKVNYLRGKDPAAWRTGLTTYAKVRYEGVYPGVDLVYYGTRGQLEYDLVLAPGVDPQVIRLAFEGADRMTLDDTGNLVLTLGEQQVIQHSPRVYQESNGERMLVPTRYVLADNRQVSLAIGDYDAGRALVIDPVLVYSTYLGGSSDDYGSGIAVDDAGNAYLTGNTFSTDFPTRQALQPDPSESYDAFVAKLSADGTTLVYASYLGGSNNDHGFGIAVDGAGNAYVTGETGSTDFPTHQALQPGFGGGSSDAFVVKLSADGATLLYASYLGGGDTDKGTGIAADGSGAAYLAGRTDSTDFPTRHALQPEFGGGAGGFSGGDAFVAKLSTDGATLVYASYLGGEGGEEGSGIAVDSAGSAYLTGFTDSTDFPTRQALQPDSGGNVDAFVAKLSTDGATLLYASYLGGSNPEFGYDIAVDGAGNAYLTGDTYSTDFPIRQALQPDFGGGYSDGFVAKISADGVRLLYASYLGGRDVDYGKGIAVDNAGNAYLTGYTKSDDFPTHHPLQPEFGGYEDSFFTKLSADGATLVYASYVGGSSSDVGHGIALDGAGNAYVIGITQSADFPTVQSLQPEFGGFRDTFVAKILDLPRLPLVLVSLGDLTPDGTQHLAVLFADAAAGTVTAQVKNAATGTLLQTLDFDADYRPLDLAVVPDQNANGAPELALLGLRATDSRVQVEVRDSLTGDPLKAIPFNPAFVPQRLAVLPDRNGNGAAELAVLGIKAGNGAIAAEIKDAATGAGLGQVFFAKAYRPVDFAAVADTNGNGAAELAVLGVDTAGQPRVELRDSRSGTLVKVLWSPKWTTPLNLAEVQDANANGTPEVAVLGQGSSSVLVKTSDAGTGDQLGVVYFNPSFKPRGIAALPDLDGNGVGELAVLGREVGGQLKTELRDAVSGTLIGNLWFDQLDPLNLAVLPDLNGNGSPEVAVLGVLPSGGVQVLIRDALTRESLSRQDF